MRYALIVAGYALILWGIYTVRREAGRGRATAYRDGQAEIEAVVEEFIAAAERVRADLDRKAADLQRLINLADDRLAKLIQAQTPAGPAAETAGGTADIPAPATPAAPAAPAAEAAASGQPALATRGAAAVAASYRAQLSATPGATGERPAQRALEESPVRAEDDEGPKEAQSVRATLAGERAEGKAGKAAKGAKTKAGGKERSRHAQVYELADGGQGVTEIARATGLSKGEVQLILDLRKTR